MSENFTVSINMFNEFAQEYAQRFMNVNSYSKHLDSFCDSIVAPSPLVLDVACGPGNITSYLFNKLLAAKLIGIDLAPAMLEIAKKQVPSAQFLCMNALSISQMERKFHAIMCSFCFPFFSHDNAQDFISQAYTILKPKGVIYISTMEGDSSKASFQSTSFSGESKVYFNFHLRENLRLMLETAGFTILNFEAQAYNEPDGSISTDLIFIAQKR